MIFVFLIFDQTSNSQTDAGRSYNQNNQNDETAFISQYHIFLFSFDYLCFAMPHRNKWWFWAMRGHVLLKPQEIKKNFAFTGCPD